MKGNLKAEYSRAWPLCVVNDLRDLKGYPVGEVIEGDPWVFHRLSPAEMASLPIPEELHAVMEFWYSELQREVDSTNGQDNGATPMSGGHMEARRVFHNNNLRIKPFEYRASR